MQKSLFVTLLFLCSLCYSCSREEVVEEVVDNNQVPDPGSVPQIKVVNYVNRLFIDLLGRTPTDIERRKESDALIEQGLSFESRRSLVHKLQSDTIYVEGDSSYKIAYYNRLYDLAKARLLEGASDDEFSQQIGIMRFGVQVARLEGDSVRVFRNLQQIQRNEAVLLSRIALRNGSISLSQMYARMLNNSIYDVINMNAFNFINASFDDLLDRFPTENEFNIAYPVIENNEGRVFFGSYIENKFDYCRVLTEHKAFFEGMVRWTYLNLMGRYPTPNEVYYRLKNYMQDPDYPKFQQELLISNEYAQF